MADELAPLSGDGTLGVGSIYGNWKLVSLIAEGGMSRVFLARHTVVQKRRAAVKVIHVGRSEYPDRLRRFQEEAEIHFSLRNENVPEFYDAAPFGDDSAVVVLEYLDGFDLAQGIQQLEKLTLGDALVVARDVLRALAVMHRFGVHRDIKPANVFLCRLPVLDGEGAVKKGRVRLLDFGFARLTNRARYTREGTKVGTLGYMSPEQHRGLEAVLASDVYALGLVLFEMLAGHRLFVPNPTSPPSPVELRRLHLEVTPDLVRDLPDAPAGVRALVARLLAKDPNDRPTAHEAAEEAQRLARVHASSARLFHDEATDPVEMLERLVAERVKEALAKASALGAIDLERTGVPGVDMSSYGRALAAQISFERARAQRADLEEGSSQAAASAAASSPRASVSQATSELGASTIRDAVERGPETTLREPPTMAGATVRTPPAAAAIDAPLESPGGPIVIPDAQLGTAPVAVARAYSEFDRRNVESVRALLGRPRFFARPTLQRDDGTFFELRESVRLGSKPTSAIPAVADGDQPFEILVRVRRDGVLEIAPADDEDDLRAIEIDTHAVTGRTALRHDALVQAGRSRFRALDLEVKDPRRPAPASSRRLAPALVAVIGPGSAAPRVHALAANLTLVGHSSACEFLVEGIPDVAFGVWMRGDDTLEIVALDTSRLPYGDAFVAIHRVVDVEAFDLGEGRTLIADNGARVRQAAAVRWAERAPSAQPAHWRR